MTYEEMVANRQAYYESERADDRVTLAGFFYERGEPLTDEVLATKEYLRRKSLGLMDMSKQAQDAEGGASAEPVQISLEEYVVKLNAFITDLEARLASAEAERDAYRKAWELPEQPITQGIVPSAGEAAANAVEHARIYKDQRDAANIKLEAAEAALKTATEALDEALHEVLTKTPMHPYLQDGAAREIKLTFQARWVALKQVREQQAPKPHA